MTKKNNMQNDKQRTNIRSKSCGGNEMVQKEDFFYDSFLLAIRITQIL
jgi:hypothetical protein